MLLAQKKTNLLAAVNKNRIDSVAVSNILRNFFLKLFFLLTSELDLFKRGKIENFLVVENLVFYFQNKQVEFLS